MRRIDASITLIVVLLAVACSRTASTGYAPDAASGGSGGSQPHSGTGGIRGSGGATGATSVGTGGAGGAPVLGGTPGTGGAVGTGGHTDGGSTGAGGTARDAASADLPRDLGTGDVSPSGDAAAGCGPGYPLGSTRPAADGCNSCVCGAGGIWACTLLYCPALDAGGVDKPSDGIGPTRDAALDLATVEVASPSCSTATTEDACKALAGCHAVFIDGNLCGCLTPGCCMTFDVCADGAQADCKGLAVCKMAAPTCGPDFAVAIKGSCYEGCVRSSTCAS